MKTRPLIILLFAVLLASCVSVNTAFYPRTALKLPPKKDANQVEVLTAPPMRAGAILGEIALGGNAASNYQNLIDAAKKRAAQIGADFILVFNTSTEYRPYVAPCFSSYNAYGTGYGYGYGNTWQANTQYSASGYSVGPRAGVLALPTMHVVAGVYYPSRLGIEWDKTFTNKLVVGNFTLGSKAQEAGLAKGDEVIGLDGIDARDSRLTAHMLQVLPGQKVTVTSERNGERKDSVVETIPN